jgi:aspartyl protease family protein
MSDKLGKHMLYAAWIIALLMLTWLFSGWLEDDPNRAVGGRVSADGAREVVLTRGRDGHYLANGRINGVEARFMLDTGATLVAIPEKLARKMGLESGPPIQVETANGTVTAYLTRLNSVSLGNIELYNIRATINPQMEGEEILLGMSFLRKLEFTQKEDTLVLRHAAQE